MPRPKIFCIGFHKTGTTSVSNALRILGYRVTGPNGIHNPRIADEALMIAHQLVPKFDAFADNPWPILFREMEASYPDSLFILTIRSPDQWIASVVNHFGSQQTPMRRWIYQHGSPLGHEEVYLKRYSDHNDAVRNHFQGRPNLLIMDLSAGDGWPQLCPFLAQSIPEIPFPHANKADVRQGWSAKRAFRAMRRLFRNLRT